jgi:ribonuclease P protein component
MLTRAGRLTTGRDFSETIRRGRRAGARSLVVHLDQGSSGDDPPRAGFVVTRSVGTAVTRNSVKRRLRHVVRAHLEELPAASRLVVRALPAAAAASSAELDRDLCRALQRARAGSQGRRSPDRAASDPSHDSANCSPGGPLGGPVGRPSGRPSTGGDSA